MKNKILALLLSLLVLVPVTTIASPATADQNPLAGSLSVIAGKGTGEPVYVSRDRYNTLATGPYRYIYPGQSTRDYWADNDMWYLPAGKDFVTAYWTSYGWQANGRFTATGWHTIQGVGLYGWIVNQ